MCIQTERQKRIRKRRKRLGCIIAGILHLSWELDTGEVKLDTAPERCCAFAGPGNAGAGAALLLHMSPVRLARQCVGDNQ